VIKVRTHIYYMLWYILKNMKKRGTKITTHFYCFKTFGCVKRDKSAHGGQNFDKKIRFTSQKMYKTVTILLIS
jgi:TPP-dependent trihydroxycyclohexane-1,2-dione (THcHDO) dehydratase